MPSPGQEQRARSVAPNHDMMKHSSDKYTAHCNPAVSAAIASAFHSASDGFHRPSHVRPIGSKGAPSQHSSPDNINEPQMYRSRPMEQDDSAPTTWSAWINEERRRSDVVDPTHPAAQNPTNNALFTHPMPPHFLDSKISEFDELASRLPHGLLGGMLESDASDTTSRSTSSRRARLGTEGSAPTMPGMDLFRHEESQNLSRLKALLGQCAQDTESIAAALAHSGLPCTLPGLTKLISKFNKSDQWRRGLAVFHALPAVGLSADATVANAALGSCDRGAAADSAWSIYYLMCERKLEADAISYKALISALCKGGQWQRGVVAFARAVEGGVPIEAATVMVLLFALTHAQQLQLAEALFCTAFGMFANMQPLLSVPWDTTTAAHALNSQQLQVQGFDPMPCGAFSSECGAKSPQGSQHGAGGTHNDPQGLSKHSIFNTLVNAERSSGESYSLEAHLNSFGLNDGPVLSSASMPPAINIGSMPASGGNSGCASAAATPSAGVATPVSQGMPFNGGSAARSRRWSSSRSDDTPAAEDSPQALLARLQDLYKLIVENGVSSKLGGMMQNSGQQAPRVHTNPGSSAFMPPGMDELANTFDHSQGYGVRESEQPNLLAALVGWQREHSAYSQPLGTNPGGSNSSGSLPSRSISRSDSVTSLGTASGTNPTSTAASASLRTATAATATNAGSPHSSRDPCRADYFTRMGPVEPGMFSSQPAVSGSRYGANNSVGAASNGLQISRTAASLGAISTDPLCAACCNAMLSAYCSAAVPEADRAARLLRLLHSAGGSLEPDVVAYNTVMNAQAARGHLKGMVETFSALQASGLRPTTATFATLMHAHTQVGAMQAVLELWYQMLQSRVLPGTVCLRSYTLAAFRCGDTGHIQDARSRYFGHLLTMPPKQAATEACIFLHIHGTLGPLNGGQWPPGLSTVELCATLMRRNGHVGHSQPPGHSVPHEPSHLHHNHVPANVNAPNNHHLHPMAQPSQLQGLQSHQHMLGAPSSHSHELSMNMGALPPQTQAEMQAQAHAQGYALAHAHAQRILQQAGGLANVSGMQLPSGQLA